MDIKNLTGLVTGNAISLLGLSMSANEVDAILSIVCSVIGLLITIVSVIISIVKWSKKAKEDGKITSDELNELENILNSGLHDLNDKIDDIRKDDKKDGDNN